jgi:hypothetical protein
MRYRRKDIFVHAEQWYPGKKIHGVHVYENENGGERAYVYTYNSVLSVKPGDYIMVGFNNEIYPMSEKIFNDKYEPFEEKETNA